MRFSYCDGYAAPLPPGHAFPMGKFAALHALLVRERLVRPEEVCAPREADWADLLTAHDADYLDRFASGTFARLEARRTGLPWSPALVRRSRLEARGTLDAALHALTTLGAPGGGIAANAGGGTHHAHAGHGEGFCLLNDVAVAIRCLQRAAWIARACVVDLDVHQGNGTAALFAGDEAVTTFSVHGARNYPARKEASTLDIALDDGTTDDAYLDAVMGALPGVLARARADVVFYVAGVDIVADDRFGRLAVTREGLRRRELAVLTLLRDARVPVVLLASGGYAPGPTDAARADATADRHADAHREAARLWR